MRAWVYPAVAIDWSVTAMTEAAGRLSAASTLPRLAAAVGEAVWWVTLVDPGEFIDPDGAGKNDRTLG